VPSGSLLDPAAAGADATASLSADFVLTWSPMQRTQPSHAVDDRLAKLKGRILWLATSCV